MIRSLVITAMSAAALFVSTAASAQQTGGTAVEARAMLTKAVAAVKEDKTKALDMFDKEGAGSGIGTSTFFVTVSATRSSSPLAIRTASRNSVRT